MRSLSDTLERLARMRPVQPGVSPNSGPHSGAHSGLKEMAQFGSNPGALKAWHHVPDNLPPAPALVVVLHGCTQTAAGYDIGSGWSALAEDYGFVVLFPEQTRANNANLCFNWFNDGDIRRDQGEVLSIRQMIDTLVAEHHLDERRIYITGLSAGGAMANAMLACYPERFAGGAIIGGLPYDAASSVPEAFDRMRGQGHPSVDASQASLQRASRHDGPWPTISVWHGTNDNTVVPSNADLIVEQWRGVHMLSSKPTSSAQFDRHTRAVWQDDNGMDAVELVRVPGMSHGTPVDASSGYGSAAPFMLDVGVSSTLQIATSWGLAASFDYRERKPPAAQEEEPVPHHDHAKARHAGHAGSAGNAAGNYVQDVIENALRSAGLMK